MQKKLKKKPKIQLSSTSIAHRANLKRNQTAAHRSQDTGKGRSMKSLEISSNHTRGPMSFKFSDGHVGSTLGQGTQC